MPDTDITLFVCHDPEQNLLAERLDAWPHTNADRAAYNARVKTRPDAPEAVPIRQELRNQIFAADVTVCFIGHTTFLDAWIAWELETAKEKPQRNGLVGIMLDDLNPRPAAMKNAGTMYVPFKRDAVEAAIHWAVSNPPTDQDFTLEE